MTVDIDETPDSSVAEFTIFLREVAALPDDPEPVSGCFESAARFMRSVTASDLLTGLGQCVPRSSELIEFVNGIDHVGFLAPITAAPYFSDAATRAGFRSQRNLPSAIFSRELGLLSGTEEVPTTIFRAGADDGSMCIEVFVAHGADEAQVTQWIGRGIGHHVAFKVPNGSVFGDIVSFMETIGFEMPAIFEGGPLTNDAAKLSVAYFDNRIDEIPIRLEFCHYHA